MALATRESAGYCQVATGGGRSWHARDAGAAARPEIALIGAITAAVVIAQATWPLVQHFEVMAHEGMHRVVGSGTCCGYAAR